MNKKLKGLLLSTVILAGLGVYSSPAFAEGTDPAVPTSEEVFLTKTFLSPEATPSLNGHTFKFDFTFTPVKVYPYGEGNTTTETFTSPEIKTRQLTFVEGDKGDQEVNGVKRTIKQTSDLLKDDSGQLLQFAKPGVYIYKVTESVPQSVLDQLQNTDKLKESLKNDTREFTLKIYVKKDANGHYTPGQAVVEDNEGNKVSGEDPNNDPNDNNENTEIEKANGFNFENVYTRNANNDPDPDPEDPTKAAAFAVKKTISGDAAQVTDSFPFKAVFTVPTKLLTAETMTMTFNTTYTPKSGETNPTSITFAPNAEDPTISTATVEFNLKGDDYAWINTLPIGVKYEVQENMSDDLKAVYTPTAINTENGAVKTMDKGITMVSGHLGDKTNRADYDNNAVSITPTGLLLNNLPYIFMAVAAVAGFGAYVALKRHQRS